MSLIEGGLGGKPLAEDLPFLSQLQKQVDKKNFNYHPFFCYIHHLKAKISV